jgi:hypothetical protein
LFLCLLVSERSKTNMFKTVCIVSVSKYTQFYHCVDMD